MVKKTKQIESIFHVGDCVEVVSKSTGEIEAVVRGVLSDPDGNHYTIEIPGVGLRDVHERFLSTCSTS